MFFKGNLHCHSTVSDGKYSHEELIDRYRNRGYSFLCFSDHRKFTDYTHLDRQDFISLPGVEWDSNWGIEHPAWLAKTHHMHGIRGNREMISQAEKMPFAHEADLPQMSYYGRDTVQEMARYMRQRGNFCIYNHPRFNQTTPEDFGLLEGYTALEIYNNAAELLYGTGLTVTYWDNLLNAGCRILGVACDDNHNNFECEDSYGGWISVNSENLTHENIINAILEGRYYSSSGPEIIQYGVRDGSAFVECSSVNHISFIAGGNVGVGKTVWSKINGDDISYAEYKLLNKESYIRVECIDKYGKTAWSNPLYPAERG